MNVAALSQSERLLLFRRLQTEKRVSSILLLKFTLFKESLAPLRLK